METSVLTAPVKMTLAELKKVETPEATRSWCPVPHDMMIESVMEQMKEETQFEMEGEVEIGLSSNLAQMFFLINLKSQYSDFCLSIGGRNAHDKKFPLAMFGGASIFICSNLQAFATYAIKTKHTTNIFDRLPNLFSSGLKEIEIDAKVNEERIDHFKNFEIEDDAKIHDWLIQSMDQKILLPTHLPTVLGDWRKPRHEEFEPRTMWSFNNCYTESFKQFNNPEHLNTRSINLTKVMDEWTLFDKKEVRARIVPEETVAKHEDGYADNYNRRSQVKEANPETETIKVLAKPAVKPIVIYEAPEEELTEMYNSTAEVVTQVVKPKKIKTKPKKTTSKAKTGKGLDKILADIKKK